MVLANPSDMLCQTGGLSKCPSMLLFKFKGGLLTRHSTKLDPIQL
jgi:hypothetical protein